MPRKTIILLSGIILLGCTLPDREQKNTQKASHNKTAPGAQTAAARTIGDISLPEGFRRETAKAGSFAAYLRRIPLKKSKTVYIYNGQPKGNQDAHFAILDIPVGNKDLQQCADAVMRLKAEYLFAQERFSEIVFRDNVGGVYAFTAPYTRPNFERYLQRVFGMCGSASLEKELKPVRDFSDIQSGDVLIRGGFPGHAEIVVDVAVNDAGEKMYLLAQSYMPAQDIHVVKNPFNDESNPWYDAQAPGNQIVTPEYVFTRNQLRRWP